MAKALRSSKFTLSAEAVIADYRLAYSSRRASVIGRAEVLRGNATFGIFGDGKEIANIAMAKACRPHERLVAVVAGAPVARAERFGHGDVGDLLAVAKDAERGVAAQHLGPADDACATAAVGQPVIGDHGFGGEGEFGAAKRFRHSRPPGGRNLRYQRFGTLRPSWRAPLTPPLAAGRGGWPGGPPS